MYKITDWRNRHTWLLAGELEAITAGLLRYIQALQGSIEFIPDGL